MEKKPVTIFTDGACLGNPGQGGYASVLIYGEHRREIVGGYQLTTNNRMEIMAAIAGLAALKQSCVVTLYSDSKYLVDSYMQGSVFRWKANGWKRGRKYTAENVDLWEKLLILCNQHEVTFQWVEGHSGNEINERCDKLSTDAARGTNLPADKVYENGETKLSPYTLFGDLG